MRSKARDRCRSFPSPSRRRILVERRLPARDATKHVPKETTDDALIQEFLKKGGKVNVGKTKPLAAELGLSNNVWNNKLTKEEKAARDKK